MKNILIIFGGKSNEHEVSIRSAEMIISNIEKSENNVYPIYITKDDGWMFVEDLGLITAAAKDMGSIDPSKLRTAKLSKEGLEIPGVTKINPDAAFSIIHGQGGEDGTIQAKLSENHIPYVGPKVQGSINAFDKELTKTLAKSNDVKVAKYLIVSSTDNVDYTEVSQDLGPQVYVKPARSGSSVGVSRATNQSELDSAIKLAAGSDDKILIEEELIGSELECGVLGKMGRMTASEVGEVVAPVGGYSFDEKYDQASTTNIIVPAEISIEMTAKIKTESIRVCEILDCPEISRVDWFLLGDDTLVLNEVNTLPGFTSISMYPKLFEAAGINSEELITRLIENASL